MSNVIKCQMSSNVKCIIQMSDVIRYQMPSNGKYHQMSNVIKCQMLSKADVRPVVLPSSLMAFLFKPLLLSVRKALMTNVEWYLGSDGT